MIKFFLFSFKIFLIVVVPASNVYCQTFNLIELDSGVANHIDTAANGQYAIFGNKNGAIIHLIDGSAQIINTYNTPNLNLYDGQQTADGGYIISGDSNRVASVVRLDTLGNKIWKLEVNNHLSGNASAVGQNMNGVFYACVNNDSVLYHDPDFFVLIDSAGSLISKTKLVSNGFVVSGESIVSLANGDWILTSTESYVEHTRLFKINSAGNIMWDKLFYDSTLNAIGFTSIGISELTPDSFLVTGSIQADTSGADFGLVYKINSNGDSIWNKKYRSVTGYRYYFIVQGRRIANGDIFLVGNQTSSIEESIILLTRINSNGDTIWTRQFPGRGYAKATSMIIDRNGNPMIVGMTRDTLTGQLFSILIYSSALTNIEYESNVNSKAIFISKANDNYVINCKKEVTVAILDVSGKIISVQNLNNGNSINLSRLNFGVYFLNVTDSDGNFISKKIIHHN